MEEWTLADAQCLDPLKRTKKFGPERSSKLTEDLIDAISGEGSKQLFGKGNEFSKDSMMD